MRTTAGKLWAAVVLVGSMAAALAACGSSDGGNGDTAGGQSCTPGAQVACDCAGGTKGVQVCTDDGKRFDACQCTSGGGTTTSTGGGDGGNGAGGSSTGTQMGACGDGVAQPGECDPGSEFACPADCPEPTGSGGGGTGGGPVDPCADHVTYAGMVANASSVWGALPNSGGNKGVEAGNFACQAIGADHVCEYSEVLEAKKNGELANIANGTTAWLQRTTDVDVNGTMYKAGAGARCNDWQYGTGHLSDGEYITFGAGGEPTFHLDPDSTFGEGHTIGAAPGVDDLPCNGDNQNPPKRAILCCFPKCK